MWPQKIIKFYLLEIKDGILYTMIQAITEYLDYRDFLYDFYKEKRAVSPFFSYRFIVK